MIGATRRPRDIAAVAFAGAVAWVGVYLTPRYSGLCRDLEYYLELYNHRPRPYRTADKRPHARAGDFGP